MAITSIPQQNEGAGQLGKSKTDGAGVYDADTKVKASQWNQIVLRMIEVITEVGLTDGSTVGSLRKAINDVIAGGSNPTDVANNRYADQPPTRTITGTTGTLGAADIGGIIFCSNAGTVTITTANLSASKRTGGAICVTIIMTGGGTLAIADGSGCTHAGSPSGTSSFWASPDGTTYYVR